jgi:FimV-like protein
VAQYNTQSNRVTTRNNRKLSSGARVVAPGETLWGIARNASKGTSISINQMILAIYQNNSSAFANGSIDLLKAGSSIDIPDFESASQIASSSATQRIKELSRPAARNTLDLSDSILAEVDSQDETLASLLAEDLEEPLADNIDDGLVRG